MKLQLLADGCRLPHPMSLPALSTRMAVVGQHGNNEGVMQVQHINDVSVFGVLEARRTRRHVQGVFGT